MFGKHMKMHTMIKNTSLKDAHPLIQNAHPTDLSLKDLAGENGKGSTVTISESLQSLLSLKGIGNPL